MRQLLAPVRADDGLGRRERCLERRRRRRRRRGSATDRPPARARRQRGASRPRGGDSAAGAARARATALGGAALARRPLYARFLRRTAAARRRTGAARRPSGAARRPTARPLRAGDDGVSEVQRRALRGGDRQVELRLADGAHDVLGDQRVVNQLPRGSHLLRRDHGLAAAALGVAGLLGGHCQGPERDECARAGRLRLRRRLVLHPAAHLLVTSLGVRDRCGRTHLLPLQHRHLRRQLHHDTPLKAPDVDAPHPVADLEGGQAEAEAPVDGDRDHAPLRDALGDEVAQPLLLDSVRLVQHVHKLLGRLVVGRRVDGDAIDEHGRGRLRALRPAMHERVLASRLGARRSDQSEEEGGRGGGALAHDGAKLEQDAHRPAPLRFRLLEPAQPQPDHLGQVGGLREAHPHHLVVLGVGRGQRAHWRGAHGALGVVQGRALDAQRAEDVPAADEAAWLQQHGRAQLARRLGQLAGASVEGTRQLGPQLGKAVVGRLATLLLVAATRVRGEEAPRGERLARGGRIARLDPARDGGGVWLSRPASTLRRRRRRVGLALRGRLGGRRQKGACRFELGLRDRGDGAIPSDGGGLLV